MNIIERLVPHWNHRPPGVVIDAIVIHDTGGKTAAGAIEWFMSPQSQVSAHVVIDKDGTIYRCVPDELRAWHAGVSSLHGRSNVNDFSLGMEIVDDNDADPYPPAQWQAAVELASWWSTKYRIPFNRIVGHQHIAPGRKTDPGKDFNWYGFLLAVHVTPAQLGGQAPWDVHS